MGGTKNREEKKKKAHVYSYVTTCLAVKCFYKPEGGVPPQKWRLQSVADPNPCCRSSGASGGANKGPAIVDKRNQVLECPHCDRTFQQVQRYREHIAKKHAEEPSTDAGDTAADSVPIKVLPALLWLHCVKVCFCGAADTDRHIASGINGINSHPTCCIAAGYYHAARQQGWLLHRKVA